MLSSLPYFKILDKRLLDRGHKVTRFDSINLSQGLQSRGFPRHKNTIHWDVYTRIPDTRTLDTVSLDTKMA